MITSRPAAECSHETVSIRDRKHAKTEIIPIFKIPPDMRGADVCGGCYETFRQFTFGKCFID